MAKQTSQTIDLSNLNAWRKIKNPNATDYVGNPATDAGAIKWAQENGFDNSKDYRPKKNPTVQALLDKANGVTTAPTEAGPTPETPVVKNPLKPANLDNDTYETLIGQGISQERINELYAPNEKNPFTRMFKEQMPEPTPIDEKKVQASRNLANLGEGIKVLGDMFGVSQGAHIERRNAGDITNRQQAVEQNERDKYLAKLDQFNQGKRGAAEKDWMLALQDKEKGLADVKATMAAKAKADADARKAKDANDKWLADYKLKAEGQKQKNANDKERNRIAGIKANKDAKTDKKAEQDKNMMQLNVRSH